MMRCAGELDKKELYIGLLRLYDILNAKLPCRVTIPDAAEVDALMEKCERQYGTAF